MTTSSGMDTHRFSSLESRVLGDPEGRQHAFWAASLNPCETAQHFLGEACWVILGSGISHKAARSMERALDETGHCAHPAKDRAIQYWRKNFEGMWEEYLSKTTDEERLAYLRKQPYFRGNALPFQLAKNLGITSYCKPDVHLVRLARMYHYPEPQAMCEALSESTGHTVAYLDTILWFACMRGWAYEFDAEHK